MKKINAALILASENNYSEIGSEMLIQAHLE